MSTAIAIRLVKSLSGSEKRFFKLYARRQSGTRDYLDLFGMIDKSESVESTVIGKTFKKKHPKVSLHNTTRYLIKVLMNCLIQQKAEKDPFFQSLHGIMRVRILQERALPEEGQRQLKKVRHQAHALQQHVVEYITYRDELNFLSDDNFRGIRDKQLVETQMKAKSLLKDLHHIQDHHSLFELLKYRLVHAGKISSDENKNKLNDLMLSEMGLVTGKSDKSFSAHKLHLLFQSFFFIDIGDYRSALKTFAALNRLFEENLELLENPPLDYLSALNGILDSLHMVGHYEQLSFYVDKVKLIDKSAYPEYFRYQVRKTAAVYQLILFIASQKHREAIAYTQAFGLGWLTAYNMVDEEKQWELFFYISLSHFSIGDWKKAHYFINELMRRHQTHSQWLICKATRLLNIIVYYEKGDTDYLEYEIRSYKRLFGRQQFLRSEILLIRFIKTSPRRKTLPESQLKTIKQELSEIQNDRYEKLLLKYFDFAEWIKKSLAH
jgi:hypothetical protein